LDQFVCNIRDSFLTEYGYPEFASNSTRTDLRCERRRFKDVKVKAFFNDPIEKCIQGTMNKSKGEEEDLDDLIFSSQITSTESLVEFQYYTSDDDEL
jgi:hypothetical protein